MAVEGTIQNGPLMEHTSYSGGNKVARVTANHATGVDVGYSEVGPKRACGKSRTSFPRSRWKKTSSVHSLAISVSDDAAEKPETRGIRDCAILAIAFLYHSLTGLASPQQVFWVTCSELAIGRPSDLLPIGIPRFWRVSRYLSGETSPEPTSGESARFLCRQMRTDHDIAWRKPQPAPPTPFSFGLDLLL
jgi:hypothetical protein